ncbi:hypothetical protein P8452_30266 [Trifolium repens]|nr:hypothetical protein P8452_30266 [Trifolium repens]
MANLKDLVNELIIPDLRENALYVLSKRRDLYHEIAPLLWNTACVVTVFLQEIISIYPAVSSLELTSAQSIRVVNVLALLQCLASHPETRMPFLNANIPQYFYPFLQTTSKLPQFEFLRIASLGVICALAKANTEETINFLLSSEVVPLCLKSIESGKIFAKTVAMFVVQKVLANDNGLEYICSTAERFFAVAKVLEMVLGSLEEQPSPRLLKYVISSYSRLSHNHRAGIALVRCIPNTLMDATFINYIREDPETLKLMDVLHGNIRSNQVSSEQGGNGVEDTGGR